MYPYGVIVLLLLLLLCFISHFQCLLVLLRRLLALNFVVNLDSGNKVSIQFYDIEQTKERVVKV